MFAKFSDLPTASRNASLPLARLFGKVGSVQGQMIQILGMDGILSCGQLIVVYTRCMSIVKGEVVRLDQEYATAIMFARIEALQLGDIVELAPVPMIAPSEHWMGEILNYEGVRADGTRPVSGALQMNPSTIPSSPSMRRPLGKRLATGIAAIDTFLPLCRGQRVGLFAGSGVGKSTLLGQIACRSHADINIIALIGERGREVQDFVDNVLDQGGRDKSIFFVATSDQPSAVKLRTANLAMTVAEHFRDQGKQVMYLCDSITRFAEAYRDKALGVGEIPALRAFPPSTFRALAQHCERAGPGEKNGQCGDITAVFSVLVAGSDMEEPVADMTRGILDGHIVLDRGIAERGRFPAIDISRSVSRSLPEAASQQENALLKQGRNIISTYEEAETILKAGLYIAGSNPMLDLAIEVYSELERFLTITDGKNVEDSFESLRKIILSKDSVKD